MDGIFRPVKLYNITVRVEVWRQWLAGAHGGHRLPRIPSPGVAPAQMRGPDSGGMLAPSSLYPVEVSGAALGVLMCWNPAHAPLVAAAHGAL